MDKLDVAHKRIVLSYFDDVDVFNFCLSNKEIGNKVCNEEFWRDRFLNLYGNIDKGDMSWKEFYMNIVIIKDKAIREKRSTLYYAIKSRNKNILDFFLNSKNRTSFDYLEGLEAAAEINDEKLIDDFLKIRKKKGKNNKVDLNQLHYRLTDNATKIMKGAIRGGHKNIVEKYRDHLRVLSTRQFADLIKSAIHNEQDEIAVLLYQTMLSSLSETGIIGQMRVFSKRDLKNELLYYSTLNKNYRLIKYFLSEGGDVNMGLKAAVKMDDSPLTQYFLSKGAKFN